MKELTAAQGLLRCGECDTIFDAMKALSTTIPEERKFAGQTHDPSVLGDLKPPGADNIRVLPSRTKTGHAPQPEKTVAVRRKSSSKLLVASLAILGLLLALQLVLFGARGWADKSPFFAKLSQNICTLAGCEPPMPRDLKQIKMLSHSVYTHPNSPNVLIISSSIENEASFEQPYPMLEISFLNNDSKVVALRRFRPEEYLSADMATQLMQPGLPKEFSLNIADPGDKAVRFQLNLL